MVRYILFWASRDQSGQNCEEKWFPNSRVCNRKLITSLSMDSIIILYSFNINIYFKFFLQLFFLKIAIHQSECYKFVNSWNRKSPIKFATWSRSLTRCVRVFQLLFTSFRLFPLLVQTSLWLCEGLFYLWDHLILGTVNFAFSVESYVYLNDPSAFRDLNVIQQEN